jgi:hypothetical protein
MKRKADEYLDSRRRNEEATTEKLYLSGGVHMKGSATKLGWRVVPKSDRAYCGVGPVPVKCLKV